MEKQDNYSIQAFDTLYTTNQIQLLKILLPFCSPNMRGSLVVMIRFMEFQYTLSFVRAHPESFLAEPLPFSLNEICEKMKNYCPPGLRPMLEQFQSMQNALQMYEEMKQMMEMFQGMEAENPAQDTGSFGQSGGFDPMNMLSGMLSPEQMEMFRMLQSDFGSTEAPKPPEKEN